MSDRTRSRIARVLAMIPYVLAEGGATLDDLRDRFNYASTDALRKDLDIIFMTGLPGYGPGELIDVDIYDDEVVIESADYFSSALRLTGGEALGLLAAGSTLLASGDAPVALARAVEKLADAMGVQVDEEVIVEVPTPTGVATLREALADNRVVRLEYVAAATNESTIRVVEGESVFFSLGAWYFRGFCRRADADRLFRIDRVARIEVLDERYVPTAADAPASALYEPAADDYTVVFDVTPNARWVAEYYVVDSEERVGDGTVRVTMRVSDPMVAARLLVRLGVDATLVSGSEVTAALDELRSRLAARYGIVT
ncbi:MAG: WYL domain-containing protein [Acidimicrobiia bacterium]|nr:WYL domain-containing protein [Acidimicrobiia bacterium]